MSRPRALPALSFILVLAAALFAVERYSVYAPLRAELTLRGAQIDEARRIAAAYPEAFGPKAASAAPANLKEIVQAAAARRSIPVTYLNESEKDLSKDVLETSVAARAVNVPHANLVAFLGDLESRGGGARIKEIRLKPAKEKSGQYDEAEIVYAISRISTSPDARSPKERAE
ncbi:MAG: hypothetical protein HY291_05080 [Planctomycetes bacterium]|nr:hypothetical protein [Planctomycetota bacterium]